LKEDGFDVIQAATGKEARLELNVGGFDALIIDGQLPDCEGTELIRELRSSGLDTPVLFVSAYWRDTDSYCLLKNDLKVQVVLHKPVLPMVLREHLSKLIGGTKQQAPAGSANDAITQKLQALSLQFIKDLPDELAEIARLITAAKGHPDVSDDLKEASRKAHMLRGTAGSFGLPRITSLMGRVEDTLRGMAAHQIVYWRTEAWPLIDSCMQESFTCVEEALAALIEGQEPEVTVADNFESSVLLVSEDDGLISQMNSFAKTQHVDLTITPHSQALDLAASGNWDAIAMEGGKQSDAYRLACAIRDQRDDVPIVFLFSRGEEDAGAALYAGSVANLFRPLSATEMVQAHEKLIAYRKKMKPKVVVIDDDPNFTRRAEAVLGYEGFSVYSFSDTMRIEEVLHDIDPQVVLLDVDMPGVSGFDVCRHLRKSSRWHDLPFIFVTAQTGWQTRVAAFECGGDDYLAKPIVNRELLLRVQTWMQRAGLRKTDVLSDHLTGLPAHSTFCKMSETLISGLAQSMLLSILLLKIDGLEKVNIEAGAEAGDEILRAVSGLLRRRFRPADVRGRWSGSGLTLAVAGVAPQTVEAAARKFISELHSREAELFKQFASMVSFKCALVHTERNDISIHELVAEANRHIEDRPAGQNYASSIQ
jgi:diguanylate cyclase (GGDEF)-like protein